MYSYTYPIPVGITGISTCVCCSTAKLVVYAPTTGILCFNTLTAATGSEYIGALNRLYNALVAVIPCSSTVVDS